MSTSRRRRNSVQRTKFHCVLCFLFRFRSNAGGGGGGGVFLISIYLVKFLTFPQIINQKQKVKLQKNN